MTQYDCLCQHGRMDCLCVPRGGSAGPVKRCDFDGDRAVCEDLENNTGGTKKMQRQYQDSGQEVDRKVKTYMSERKCSYGQAMRAVGREDPDLADRYSRREQGYNVYQDGVKVHGMAREYMREHGWKGDDCPSDPAWQAAYKTALRAVVRESEEKAQEMAEERDRRIPVYQSEFNIKSYEKARARVLRDDPTLTSYEQTAYGRLWNIIAGVPRRLDGSFDVERVLRHLETEADLCSEAAGERIDRLARQWITNQGLPGHTESHMATAQREVMRMYPALEGTYNNGRNISEEALRDMYPNFR